MSKRKLSTESIGSLNTANVKQNIIWFVQLVSSVKAMMQMLHTQKQLPALKYLSNWISHQQLQEIDKKLLTELFIKNDAKFHKSCTNQFSDMKTQRDEKNLRANEDQITEDVFGTEKSCSSTIPGSSKRTSSRSRTTNDSIAKSFFCDSSDGILHKGLTIQLEKRVRKCANILEDDALLRILSAGDMIALDAIYHFTCVLNLYRECNQKETEVTYDDTDKQI